MQIHDEIPKGTQTILHQDPTRDTILFAQPFRMISGRFLPLFQGEPPPPNLTTTRLPVVFCTECPSCGHIGPRPRGIPVAETRQSPLPSRNHPFQLSERTSITKFQKILATNKPTIALFEAGTYAPASQRIKTVPLVMRDVDQRFVTIFIARTDEPRNALEDFRGSTIAMGDPRSTRTIETR